MAQALSKNYLDIWQLSGMSSASLVLYGNLSRYARSDSGQV